MAWKHRTSAQEMEVIELTRGYCQREIAELTGLSKWTVGDVQRKYHLVLSFGRSHSSAQFRYAWDEEKWGRVLEELYVNMRLPIHEVAARCGVDKGTIRRRLDKLGFGRRSTGESNRGTKRGRYRTKLPRCASPDCDRGVGVPGETRCAVCRRERTF